MRIAMLALVAAPLAAQVPFERILAADDEPGNWLTYSRTLDGQRYSPLAAVNRNNVASLRPAWIYQTWSSESRARFETSPLAVDGVLYITEQPSDAAAIDARTGRPFWKYRRDIPQDVRACCGRVNRGMAILGDTLFLTALDGYLVALDRVTGRVRWTTHVADRDFSYSLTAAPLAVKDKIVVGVSGGEYGIRGFLDAYDAATGKLAWRFWTVPGPGEPGNETWSGDSWKTGGAGTWTTGTYDPELDLIYWGTGNPGPDYDGSVRRGDNLYSCSLVALDAGTGKLKWHFQFTPHDVHDWDSNHVPVLADGEFGGRKRKVVMVANRNAFFYVLDRETGEFLLGKPFARQTWARGLDPKGRPILIEGMEASERGTLVYPGLHGGTNWFSPSLSRRTGLFYVSTRDEGTRFYVAPTRYRAGALFTGGGPAGIPGEEPTGWVQAIEPATGERKWKFETPTPPWAGVLSTAGGLVFTGSNEGTFFALDDETGKPLWHFQTGGWINANPMSYSHMGRQYVVVPSGRALIAFAVEGEP
jgi:alcohol dehydrogenase (cytochrome c)